MTRYIGLALLAFVLAPGAARAADYTPVTCTAAKPYAGPTRHAAIDLTALQPAGDLQGTFDAATAGRLATAFDKVFAATKAHAMTVAVGVPGRGIWTMQRGGPLFYWARTGKQATAAIILQLAEEGRLSLSGPIARWIAGVPNGEVITIGQLLNHTSGLFSANEDLRIHRENRRLDADAELPSCSVMAPWHAPASAGAIPIPAMPCWDASSNRSRDARWPRSSHPGSSPRWA